MRILVCTDFTAGSLAGEREAAHRFRGAMVVVFHATDPKLAERLAQTTGMDKLRLREAMAHYADSRMTDLVEWLRQEGLDPLPHLAEGDPVPLALDAATQHGADLILLSAPAGEPVGRFRTLLLRTTTLPVLFIPSRE